LGVTPGIDNQALKIHYRKLVADNHPDKMIARGVPPEFVAIATRRSPPSTRPMRNSLESAATETAARNSCAQIRVSVVRFRPWAPLFPTS
jgi:hypothetical protein